MYHDDEIDLDDILFLYELRHACNVLDEKLVAKRIGMPVARVVALYESDVSGSEDILQFFNCSDDEFYDLIDDCEDEECDRQIAMYEAQKKNEMLVADLESQRTKFAGIGTNKAKRRLNKLALNDPVAKAVRIALEIEDKSISAKKAYGKYQERIYNQKTKFILDLCHLFKEQGWVYGTQKSEVPPTSHVIYFEIPGCKQISWHFSPEKKDGKFPRYENKWDGKKNSTMRKLEAISKKLLDEKKSLVDNIDTESI